MIAQALEWLRLNARLAPLYDRAFRSHQHRSLPVIHPHASTLAKRRFAFAASLTRAEHARLARAHWARAKWLEQQYQSTVNEAFQDAYGRAPEFSDYRISAVWRDDMPVRWKHELRRLCRAVTREKDIAALHAQCARMRSIPK